MDCSFLFAATACLGSLLYICTLFLSIQYRGDFGLIADADDTIVEQKINKNTNFRNRNANNSHSKNNINNNKSDFYDNTGASTPTEGYENTINGILDIPITDLNFLFWSKSNSNSLYNYGNKNNLKINFKDV